MTTASPPAERLPVYACAKTHARAAQLFGGWPREGRVLELAAGSGAFAQRLAELGFSLEACDLYPEQFRAPGIPVKYADLSERLPYADASFDILSCLEGVEHLEDQFAFVRECWRILRPGGRLLFSTPNILGLASRWRYFWTGFFPLATRPMNEHQRAPVHDHIHLITYYELRYILRTTGFTIEQVTTDRIRKYGLLHGWAYPLVWLATRRALRREPDAVQRRANEEIARHMLSPALLFGRTLMVVAGKPS
ncbi:MAG: class I SAM-dependent methyltransferase [Gemmatimonadales bacterium]|nr:class I SAM-dependent methyltransferase [Gemmatimonadales bacterium]